MSVRTFVAVYEYRDYAELTSTIYSERVKARSMKEAQATAEQMLTEAMPDTTLLEVRRQARGSHNRFDADYYLRLLRRQRTGLRMFHRKNRPYRRGCHCYPTWKPNFHYSHRRPE